MQWITRWNHVVLAAAILGAALTAVCGLRAADPPGKAAGDADEAPAGPAPILDVKVVPSAIRTTVNSKVSFELVVTNVGKSAATNLLVVDQFEAGLEHAVRARAIERDLAELAPGKSQRLTLTFRVTKTGLLSHNVEVRANGETVATAKGAVLAVEADSDQPDAADVEKATTKAKKSPFDAITSTKVKPPAKQEAKPAVSEPEKEAEAIADPLKNLGEPLVDNPKTLKQLNPEYRVWVDRPAGQVVLLGGVCLRRGYLELFACLRGSKEHESILTIPTKASYVHAALLAVGAEPGAPVQFQPKYAPARGDEIEVTLRWKDKDGKVQTARAQDWVREVKTKKAMQQPWVFGGSQFDNNKKTGQVVYQADREGDLICVSNFPDAVLDLPIESTSENSELLFEAFTERIPPVGTAVTVILKPKKKAQAHDKAETEKADTEKPAAGEKPAAKKPAVKEPDDATEEPAAKKSAPAAKDPSDAAEEPETPPVKKPAAKKTPADNDRVERLPPTKRDEQ